MMKYEFPIVTNRNNQKRNRAKWDLLIIHYEQVRCTHSLMEIFPEDFANKSVTTPVFR